MKDVQWMIRLIASVLIATIAALTSIRFSGYYPSGILTLLLSLLTLSAGVGFAATSFKLLNARPVNHIEFDAAGDNTLSELILHTPHNTIDARHRIRFYPLIDSGIFFNPLSSIAVTYLFFCCTLYLTIGANTITFVNYMFLLAQTVIIFGTTLILFMAAFQLPSIMKYLNVKTGLLPEGTRPMRLISSLLNGKSTNVKAIAPPEKEKEVSLNDKLAPALNVLSPPIGVRFKNLYASVVDLSYEMENISKDFHVPTSNFSDELALINEVVNVFYPTTIANCEKTFSNTTLTKELQAVFQEKVERSIVHKIRSYEEAVKKINIRLLEMRLSPFDTSGIDGYVEKAHLLNHKIGTSSGVMTNKHLIISQSVIKDLLPSLVKTWSMADTPEQKNSIESQFEELILFLESQLAALEVSDSASKIAPTNQQLLSLDISSDMSLTELNSKIGQNGQYIKILKEQWN